MIGTIFAVFVVLAIFLLVGSLLALYVWRVDPNRVAIWMGLLRARREARDNPT